MTVLNIMLGRAYGGLEKVFVDQLLMLHGSGLGMRGVARRGSEAAARARALGLPVDTMPVFSDWDPITIGAARALVDRYKPSLLLCHGRRAHQVFARATGGRVPIVAQVHKPKFDYALPTASVIVVAEHRKRMLVAAGVPAEHIAVVPNAVALPDTCKTDYRITGTPHIVALGRLHPKKGFDILIGALQLLDQRGVAFSCSIAGEGPLRGELAQRIEAVGLGRHIALPGWVEDVPAYLAQGDVFAFPSFQEDFPLAVLDAMASGLPIVSSNIDGPNECLVEGETALFVPPGDAAALAMALERLLKDEALRKKLGTNARKEAERTYSFGAVGEHLSHALAATLERAA